MLHSRTRIGLAVAGLTLFTGISGAMAAQAPDRAVTNNTALVAAGTTLSGIVPPKAAAPVMIQVAEHRRGHSRHRGRNVGIGIAAATAAAILLSQGARASEGGGSHSYNCRRWDRKCDEGSDWACRKVRREC